MIRFLFLSLLFSVSHAQASPKWEEWDGKMWLVHTTPIMLKNSTATAGALNYGRGPRVISGESNIHCRRTLHNCLGGIAPDETMALGGSFMGINMLTAIDESMTSRPYVYMEPWGRFSGEIIGGNLMDTFLFGDHTYSRDSVVFVPKEKEENFAEANPKFEGTPIFYDPKTQKTDDLVRDFLKRRGAWTIDFIGGKNAPDSRVKIDEVECNRDELQRHFVSKVSYVGHHNHSLFKLLETVLEPFTRPFLNLGRGHLRGFVPKKHDRILRGLVDSLFQEIQEAVPTGRQRDLQVWKREVHSWLDFHGQLKQALDGGRKIEEAEGFNDFLALRHKPTELTRFLETCSVVENSSKHISRQGMELFEPTYLENFHMLPATTLGRIWMVLEDHLGEDTRYLAQLKAYIAITRILLKDSGDEAAAYLPLLEQALPEVGKLDVTFSDFDDLIIQGFCFKEEGADPLVHEASVLRTLSLPPMRRFLNVLYEGIELSDPISVRDLVPYTRATRGLYSDEHAQAQTHVLFLRNKLVTTKVTSFNDACGLARLFLTFSDELKSGSLALGAPEMSSSLRATLAGMNAAFGMKVGSEFPSSAKQSSQAVRMLKAGAFGTLDDIFGFYGLQKEFRARFPKDKDLWECRESLTLPQLLRQLESHQAV